MKTQKYIIQDWAGNHLFKDKTFNSFDDGFAFLQETFEDDNDIQEYFVVPEQN